MIVERIKHHQQSPLKTLRHDHKLKVVTGKPVDNQRNVYLTVSFQKVVPRRYLKVPIVSRAIQFTFLWKTNHASKVKLGNHHFHLLPQNVWYRLKIKVTIYPPRKLTCPLKRDYFKRKLHLPTIGFQGQCWTGWWFQSLWNTLYSQIENLPQIGVKIKKSLNHHLVNFGSVWKIFVQPPSSHLFGLQKLRQGREEAKK